MEYEHPYHRQSHDLKNTKKQRTVKHNSALQLQTTNTRFFLNVDQ